MGESTIELIRELQLVAKHVSPQGRAKLDLPLLTALTQKRAPSACMWEAIDAAVADAAARPESAQLAILFPPSSKLWDRNLSGRQRQAAAELGMSYDSFRRRRNGRPSPYDDLCEALLEQLVRSLPEASPEQQPVLVDPVVVDLTVEESNRPHYALSGSAEPGPVLAAGTGAAITRGPGPSGTDGADTYRDRPVAATDIDIERPRASRKVRLGGVVAVGALVLVAVIVALQLRTTSSDPIVDEQSVTTTSVDLGSPVGLVAVPADASIELSWAPAFDGGAPHGYDIARDDVGYWSIDDPSVLTFTDESVEPGRTYSYAVTPWLANGSDDPADRIYGPSTDAVDVAITLVLNTLGQPIDFVAVSTAAGVRLEWSSSNEGVVPDGFDIARDQTGYWTLDDASIRSFVDELAEPGQTYTYAVTPWLANGSDDPADRTYGPSSANATVTVEG